MRESRCGQTVSSSQKVRTSGQILDQIYLDWPLMGYEEETTPGWSP